VGKTVVGTTFVGETVVVGGGVVVGLGACLAIDAVDEHPANIPAIKMDVNNRCVIRQPLQLR
jgi:hypothetical protein